MNSRTSRVRKQRIGPTALVVATVALTICTASATAYRVGRPVKPDALSFFSSKWNRPSVDDACLSYVGEYSVGNSEPNDVLFTGDSACRFDIDCNAFSRATGLRCYNLGTFAQPAVLSPITNAYLSKHPRPRVIYLLLAAFSLGRSAELDPGTAPWRFAEIYGQPIATDPRAAFAYFARRGMVDILNGLRTVGRPQPPDLRSVPLRGMDSETYWSLQRKVQDARGHWPLPGEHNPHRKGTPSHGAPIFMSGDWSSAIEEVIASCDEFQIPLVLRISPISGDVRDLFDFSAVESRLSELSARHPKLRVCKPAIDFYDESLCWDMGHLNAAGVARLMPVVAKDVNAVHPGALRR